MNRGQLILNEDCNHFAYTRKAEQLTPQGVDELVDNYARDTQVSELAFNVNAMRSAIPSKVKQTFWDGYDPTRGMDQPFFQFKEGHESIAHWVSNMLLLQQRGIDIYKRWIDRSRHYGVSPWISIRMNDVHNVDDPKSMMHDRLWREHPEYWRVTWREYESAHDRAINWEEPAVRDNYLAYTKEVIERYDMDGLELDWQRSVWCFRVGHEQRGAELLNEFTAQVRRMLDQRGKQLGHRIKLSARVPADPEISRRMGFDAVTWARAGHLDKVVPTSAFATTEFDMPIEMWKQLLHGTNTLVAAGLECSIQPYPFSQLQFLTPEMVRGLVASHFDRGADQIYLYNFMDGDAAWHGNLTGMLRENGSAETIAGKPRRHPLSYNNTWPAGHAAGFPLPHRLSRYGYRPTAEFRIPIGPPPRSGEPAQVRLGLHVGDASEDIGRVVQAYGRKLHVETPVAADETVRALQVRVGGVACGYAGSIALPADDVGPTHAFNIPADALRRGDNVIEISCKSEDVLTVQWVEIAIGAQ